MCKFATQLFDDLLRVHAFGDRDRLLLRAAAMLHDIGDYVHYSGHHKHSQYLIQHADIMGLTPDERAIVANIARYHRKGPPDPAHIAYRDLSKESRGKVRGLAAILRIADALDREHKQKIESVRAAVDRGAGHVTLPARQRRRPAVDGGREGVPLARRLRPRHPRREGRGRRGELAGGTAPAFAVLLAAGSASVLRIRPRAPARAPPSLPTFTAALYAMMTSASREARSRGELEAMLDSVRRAELADQGKALSGPDVRVEASAVLHFADGGGGGRPAQGRALRRVGRGRACPAARAHAGGRARSAPQGAREGELRRAAARALAADPRGDRERPADSRRWPRGPETLPVQQQGDTAVVQIPGGHQVKLRRESGIWHVEDFD